jgi:flagellin-like hook-associated protein FlgL
MGSWGTIYGITRSALEYQARQLARLQAMTASGSRILHPSDSPTEASSILGLHTESALLQSYMRNIGAASDSLGVASTAMQNISSSLARVRELVTQASSGTYLAKDRVPIANEVNSLLEQIWAGANTSHLGQYLFAGNGGGQAPYEATYENGQIVKVEYTGGDRDMPVPVAPGVEQSGVLVGDTIFRNNRRQAPAFMGDTGAKAGAGTATVRGDVWLTARHLTTTYLGASGIAPGTSSAGGDTILGASHTLAIDAVNKTLRLDDGSVVSFAGHEADTDFKLTNAHGDAVYVDLGGLDGAFQGTVAIRTTGTLSIDDGQSTVPLDETDDNLAVTDQATGRVLYVNCTGLARTGVEAVRNPGTYDLFGALISLRDALLNTDNLSTPDIVERLSLGASALEEASAGVTQALTTAGARLQALESLRGNLDDLKAYADQQAGNLASADVVQVAAELARYQTLYGMTLASASRLLSMSLLDYLD